jgi:ABC-type sugar transport system substrate-binding protein
MIVRSSGWFVLPFVAMTVMATACGTDSSNNNNAAPANAAVAGSTKAVVAAPPTRPPGSIQVGRALSKSPPKGKKLIFLQCELPACARYVPGINAATAALGWSAKTEVFKNADPGGALQQAINEHPDYIAITGIPAAALKPQLAAATRAGIPVISCATPDRPSPGGYAVQCGGTLATDADYVARWMINDSGGKGHMVALTIPQFPVLNTETDWLKANLKRLCSGCASDQLDLTIDDVAGGQVASKLIAFLQSHPGVNYVYFTFNDLSRGVPAALKAAGFGDKVKLVGAAGDAAIMKTIGSGQDAWTIAPNVYSAWVMVDAMARLATGERLSQDYANKVYASPTWVVDSAGSAKRLAPTKYDWYGPEGFQEKFKALWNVGA